MRGWMLHSKDRICDALYFCFPHMSLIEVYKDFSVYLSLVYIRVPCNPMSDLNTNTCK